MSFMENILVASVVRIFLSEKNIAQELNSVSNEEHDREITKFHLDKIQI